MKREAKLLLNKALSSLVLSVDHFNASSDKGRAEAVLIFLDHAFEMLLKASLVERGTRIREKGAKNTIGFDHCVRKALTEGGVQFLTEDQALNLLSGQAAQGLNERGDPLAFEKFMYLRMASWKQLKMRSASL